MKPTVLLVDDSAPIHQLAWSYFLDEPWHVCSAYSGIDGLDMAAATSADLVLLDVDLPDMNGFDVCRHLAVQPKTSRSAVIFLTASSSIDEKVCGLQLGAFDYITKPFDPEKLALRVRKALSAKLRLDVLPEAVARCAIKGHTASLIAAVTIGEARGAA